MKFDGVLSPTHAETIISAHRLKSALVIAVLVAAGTSVSNAALQPRGTRGVASPSGLAEAVEAALGKVEDGRHVQLLQQQEVIAPDSSELGYSVAMSRGGHLAFIGGPAKYNGIGSAYIFREDHGVWNEEQEFSASDGVLPDQFGYSVALSNDGRVAMIGANAKNSGSGAVYVFTEDDRVWTQQQKLIASDSPSSAFGAALALSGDGQVALIGAFVNNWFGGAAYIFTKDHKDYVQQQKLMASDAALNSEFGYSVALSSDGCLAVVGAPFGNFGNSSAYVFTGNRHTFTQQQELTRSEFSIYPWFGWSVAIDDEGRVVLIGSPSESTPAVSTAGAVYIFKRQHGTYTQVQQFAASDPKSGGKFG